eukprot:RCo021441
MDPVPVPLSFGPAPGQALSLESVSAQLQSICVTLDKLSSGQERIMAMLASSQKLPEPQEEEKDDPDGAVDDPAVPTVPGSGSGGELNAAEAQAFAFPAFSVYSRFSRALSTVLYPDHPARVALHMYLTMISVLEFIVVSTLLVSCPETEALRGLTVALLVAASVGHLVELLLNFNTAVRRHKWETVETLSLLRKLYLQSWFVWDLVVSLPLDLIALAAAAPETLSEEAMCVRVHPTAFGVLVFLRLLHVVRIVTYFSRRNPILVTSRWVHAVKFFSISLVVLQSLAIGWLALADPHSELGEHVAEEEEWYPRYLASMTFTISCFLHGHGELGAHVPTMVFEILMKLIGFIIVTIMEARLAEMFVNEDPFHGLARQRKMQLASIITQNKVPWEVQKSLMLLYPTLLESSAQDQLNVMKDLPGPLRRQISRYIRIRLISKVPMFEKTSESCRYALAMVLHEEVVGVGHNLVTQGEVATAMYFLTHGMVEVVVAEPTGREKHLATLKEGSWFGEIALMQETTRTASVRAMTGVKVFRLDRRDFHSIAAHYPELVEGMREVADARVRQLGKRAKSDPRASSGTAVSLRVPLQSNPESEAGPFSPGPCHTGYSSVDTANAPLKSLAPDPIVPNASAFSTVTTTAIAPAAIP